MSDRWDQAFWDERYSSQAALWSGEPNPQLVAETDGLAPGPALDVGCGEGADAMWLAARSWQVTGVDISEVVDALPGDGWTVVTDTVVIRRRPGHDQPAHDLVVRAVRTP